MADSSVRRPWRGDAHLSRRRLIGGAALGAAGLATGGLRLAADAAPEASTDGSSSIIGDPKPTTAGIVGPNGAGWHLSNTGVGGPNASIFDFDGLVAGADIRGPGWIYPSGDLNDQANAVAVEFDADVRLMVGRYNDRGGHERHGAFAFI